MGKEAERLVVEVVAAHNLMPKDGQGSSSAFVEVEFEHQKRRTRAKAKDLNPIWNERLVFGISDPDDLPYRSIDVGVYNERGASAAGRNFLGKVRVPAAGIPAPGEEAVPQLFTLEKRSLFSHIRGEISLKIYRIGCGGGDSELAVGPAAEKAASKEKEPEKNGSNNNKKKNQQQQPQQTTVVVGPTEMVQPQRDHHHNNKQPLVGPALSEVPVRLPVPPAIRPPAGPDLHLYHPIGMGPAAGVGGCQDFSLKETRPRLGGSAINKDKTSSTYDLVEQMQYLYVKVVRVRDLSGGGETHAEVKLGNYRGVTRSSGHHLYDQVFAFSKDAVQSSFVEILVKEKDGPEFLGRIRFDLSEVPKRVPPDSTLAPHWCRLEDKKGEKLKAEIMVSVWFGTQADESFAEAWHSKAAGVQGDVFGSIKSKVYVAPKLWYLRVSVIEAQDLVPGEKGAITVGRYPELSIKAQVGNQLLRTRPASIHPTRGPSNPFWNEDLMFVVAEPFDDVLIVSVEDRIGPNHDEPLGSFVAPVAAIERRLDDKPVVSRWFGLANSSGSGHFAGRIHLRLCLDGGYHVLDEANMFSSDLRPPVKQLWSPHVGVLELGILGATGLMPMKVREGNGGTTDAYCVAKYGQKWIRTRTVIDSVCPKWNEQYTWEVFDPCTVITVGVFDNSHVSNSGGGRDARIGKVRIWLSSLEADRVYTHSYPLVMLHPTGVKKMGELQLAVRFSCINAGNLLHSYIRPLLPKMHYVDPLLVRQVESLRIQATNVVAMRLARAEPPLGREVVEYMLDHGSNLWSMRKSKANFFRLVAVLSTPIAVGRWIGSVRSWQHPVQSTLFVATYIVFVAAPELILPTALLMMAVFGLWRYRSRPRHPPHMDTRLSCADTVLADELDEEFDTFPTSRSAEIVRMRYDRLRSVAGRVQAVVGDMATQAERVEALLGWRDPRATFLFLMACLAMAVVLYTVPLQLLVGGWGLYALTPPSFRSRLPSPVMNFFRRLPAKADSLL